MARPHVLRRVVVLGFCASLVLALVGIGFSAAAKVYALTPLPLISRSVPAHTNDDCVGQSSASLANDGSYDTQWHACNTPSALLPTYLAYDLSGVAASARSQVVVAWYNDPTTLAYDHTFTNAFLICCATVANDIPSSYTIEGNAAPGGSLPALGWVELARVSGNVYHSRQHVVDLTGYNWLRMNVTASDGWALNLGVRLNLDLHDAAAGVEDDWIFFGDSITETGMAHDSLSSFGGSGTWAQLINARNRRYFPAYEDGGIGGTLSSDGVRGINTWLSLFPGRYVGLSYGTNDAGFSSFVSPEDFYNNYATMVEAVINVGKVPIVPTIPWGCSGAIQANGPALNQQIARLYANYPDIVRGPDLWAYYSANRHLISSDCVHPTGQGYVAYRQQWANAMWANVYRHRGTALEPEPEPTPTPTPILPLPPLPLGTLP